MGAVAAYLVLVIAAMTSADLLRLRTAWVAMELIGWYLLVPLAFATLLTGLVMSVGTPWGVFRHYWVVASLVLTSVATAVLLGHMPTVSTLTSLAARSEITDVAALRGGLRGELLHAGVGLMVLFVIEWLNVHKPRGMTAYGLRKVPHGVVAASVEANAEASLAWASMTKTPLWVKVVGLHAVGLAVALVIAHLVGDGLRHH
jgi:hypothetical protein